MKTLGVVGAGTMGSGIAQLAARSGLDVLLHDVSQKALSGAMDRIRADLERAAAKGSFPPVQVGETAARIHPRDSLNGLRDAEFVIEAAAENLDVKRAIVRDIEAVLPPGTVVATNTSSLSITAIAAFAATPSAVVGMHFFNPPAQLLLVEVVRGARTSDETLRRTLELALRMNRKPIVCADTPGFIVNRIARPFYGEALRLLGDGIADVETIDRIIRRGGGFPMGPFELMDLIGIDVNYAVTCSVYEQYFQDPRFRPHPLQRQMVESGRLGRKTKHGFYKY